MRESCGCNHGAFNQNHARRDNSIAFDGHPGNVSGQWLKRIIPFQAVQERRIRCVAAVVAAAEVVAARAARPVPHRVLRINPPKPRSILMMQLLKLKRAGERKKPLLLPKRKRKFRLRLNLPHRNPRRRRAASRITPGRAMLVGRVRRNVRRSVSPHRRRSRPSRVGKVPPWRRPSRMFTTSSRC